MDFLLTALGLVLVLEGIPWFLSPRGTKELLRQVKEIADPALRWFGLAAMGTGLLLVYWGVK